MNKKGIINFFLMPQFWIVIGIVLFMIISYSYFKPKPYTLCTENYEEVNNYLEIHNIEVGKRWKQENKECYKTYDARIYSNLVNLTNELEYRKFKDKLKLEDKKNQWMWDFIERNKFYIGGVFVLIFIIYMYFKHKNKQL